MRILWDPWNLEEAAEFSCQKQWKKKRSDKRRNVSMKVHATVCLQTQGLLFSFSALLVPANINETYQLCHSVGTSMPLIFIKIFLKWYFSCIWRDFERKKKNKPLFLLQIEYTVWKKIRNYLIGHESLIGSWINILHVWQNFVIHSVLWSSKRKIHYVVFVWFFLITLSCLQVFGKFKQKDLF